MTNPLDMKFDRFLTLWLVKALWGCALVFGALWLVGGIIYGIAENEIAMAFYTPLGVVIALVLLRIWLELVMVLFRIADNTAAIARQTKAPNVVPPTPVAAPVGGDYYYPAEPRRQQREN
jgi:hypothetical protein